MEKERWEKASKELRVRMNVDVLVVGGGPSGIIAALAAADDGLKVALIENHSFLGGNMTIGLPILGFLGQKGNQIIEGLPQKFIDQLKLHNAASEHRPCPLHMSFTLVEPETVKIEAFKMLVKNGVNVMLYTFCAGVIMENNYLQGVIIESKSGREVIKAKIIIDCSGDADVAFKSGVPFEKGDKNGGLQPPTLMFSFGNVDLNKLRHNIAKNPKKYQTDYIPPEYYNRNHQFIVVGLRNQVIEAKKKGINLQVNRTIIITGLKKNEAWINMTRVNGIDGTDPESLTKGEYIARRQIEDISKYLTTYIPGFEKSSLLRIASFLGIRETRRIIGKYKLSSQDILNCRKFEDSIAVGSYPIDIHHPSGGDTTLKWCGDCYDIPYRSLLPIKVKNLLVAGRSISTSHEGMSAIRVMATCMAMGEAAGRAAKIAVKTNVTPSMINIAYLRNELLSKGAYLRK